MGHAVHRLAGADAAGVVGVPDTVKALELSAFFPRQRMTEIRGRVALRVVLIGERSPVGSTI